MIIQEPVQAAIWHCLNHYDYEDATFLAEKLCAEVETDDSIFLLATCYYRSRKLHQAFRFLKTKSFRTPQCRYLFAKCAYDLKKYGEAEMALVGSSFVNTDNLDEIAKEFGEVACFALQLVAKICRQTERSEVAVKAHTIALKLSPFLWHSFTDLCHLDANPDPQQIFQFSNTDIFATCQGSNLNSMLLCNGHQQNNELNNMELITTLNTSSNTYWSTHSLQTPENAPHVQTHSVNPTQNSENSPCNLDESGTPVASDEMFDGSNEFITPYRKPMLFKYLQAFSPATPSFGVLPISSSPITNDQSMIIMTQQNLYGTQSQLIEDPHKTSKKLKGNSGVFGRVREQPLQQSKPIFNQSGNITPRAPGNQIIGNHQPNSGQIVRRSSRLYSNTNYSVKENTKSPNIKFTAPRSPPRKNTKRMAKLNLTNSSFNDIVDQHKVEKEKIETITTSQNQQAPVQDNKVLLNNSINSAQTMVQHILNLKKQSADGLMSLLCELGKAYLQLSQYNCAEAIQVLESLPEHHYHSNWVQSIIAYSHYEMRNYEAAVDVFREVHERDPCQLEYMEYYSTALWHLQREVPLVALAQDFLGQDKLSPVTWCVAGNCFSLHKEHETAIKYFQRAVQVNPDFVYSYTLLGHELAITEELDKAMQCFRAALLREYRHYNAWFGLGTIYSKQERYQLAEVHYERALKLNPKNSIIMVHIGAMQFHMKKMDKALQTLNRAIALDPKSPLCKFHRGSYYFAMGKNQEALNELEELKQIVPKESVVYYLIGKIHRKLGNDDLALMHFSWATDLDPKGANNQIKDALDTNVGPVGNTSALPTTTLGSTSSGTAESVTTGSSDTVDGGVIGGLVTEQQANEPTESQSQSGESTMARNSEQDLMSHDYDGDSGC